MYGKIVREIGIKFCITTPNFRDKKMFGKTFEMAQELFSSMPLLNDEQVDALANSCFEVDRVPLVTPNGTVSKDHSFLYRPDSDAILGTVGNRYEVVDNVDVLVPAMNSILNSGLDLTDLKVNVSLGNGGASTFVTVDLPAHTVQMGRKIGDIGRMALKIINSYDGSLRATLVTFVSRYWCTNGCMVNGSAESGFIKHTSQANVPNLVNNLKTSLELFKNSEGVYEVMSDAPLPMEKAWQFMNLFLGRSWRDCLKDEFALSYINEEKLRENSSASYIWEQHRTKYVPELGNNCFAFYNALTDWATHKDTRSSAEGNRPVVEWRRHQDVDRFTRNRHFLDELSKVA